MAEQKFSTGSGDQFSGTHSRGHFATVGKSRKFLGLALRGTPMPVVSMYAFEEAKQTSWMGLAMSANDP
jgi:hypothetical protein